MADPECFIENNFVSESHDIGVFLNRSDLLQFEEAFKKEGVTKCSHILDITCDDLTRIGKFERPALYYYRFLIIMSVY